MLTPEGLEHCRLPSRGSGLRGFAGAFAPGADMGRDGCSLNGIVRHPYDLWKARYTITSAGTRAAT